MQRILLTFAVVLFTMISVAGCTKSPTPTTTILTERMKTLEAKNARLEGDLRATGMVREQLRQQLVDQEVNEASLRDQIAQLQVVLQERDALKNQLGEASAQLKARTGERDMLNTQFESFRRQLRVQLEQTESNLSQGTRTPATTPVGTIVSGS